MISLDGITFEEGIHIIRGRVGSGKSTLAGRLAKDAEFLGRRRILLLQEIEYHLTEDTVGKEIASWNVTGDEPAFVSLGKPDITRDPYTLSRGELKRLLLSCILSTDADCLILDEPYSSLDSDAKDKLTELLRGRLGVTILFTHEMPNLDAVFREIREGKLCRI